MQTVNISLPESLASKVDAIIRSEGYASRSEFIRGLIRFYLLSQKKEEVVLLPFTKVPLKALEKEMKASGRYSGKFIRSVVRGLSKSSVYAKNTPASQ